MIQWAAHSLRHRHKYSYCSFISTSDKYPHCDIERMVYRLSESKKEKNNRMFMRKMSRTHGQ